MSRGFSERELQQLLGSDGGSRAQKPAGRKLGAVRAARTEPQPPPPLSAAPQPAPIADGAKLAPLKQQQKAQNTSQPKTEPQPEPQQPAAPPQTPPAAPAQPQEPQPQPQSESQPSPRLAAASEPALPGGLTLQDVEERKRAMEEANRKRQALLRQMLASRQTKAVHEAAVLRQLQTELQTLERNLSSDVSILREKIEDASRMFETARQRYDRAEAEYIAAKLDMQQKRDHKQALTEHLLVIIQKSEERKAQKLDELMLKMNISEQEAAEAARRQAEIEARVAAEAELREKEERKRREERLRQEKLQAAQAEIAAGGTAPDASTNGDANHPTSGATPIDSPTTTPTTSTPASEAVISETPATPAATAAVDAAPA